MREKIDVDLDELSVDEIRPECDAGKVPCYADICKGGECVHVCREVATWWARDEDNNVLVLCCDRHAESLRFTYPTGIRMGRL